MRIFNTLGRALVDFEPRDPGKVGMYVCGPTVQASPHVGHGRAAVVFDVIRRYFEWRGYEVTYVQNVTDVDDKIIDAAASQGVATEEVARRAYEAFHRAYSLLGVREPDVEPRATDHIPEMIDLVERLVATDHAYESGGDVYFAVRSYPPYGKLSGHDLDMLVSGARVEPGEHKRDPLDFALWKAAKPGEPRWDSPWGPGRPGWHIECSAMSRKYLGDGFDIHGGGQDLIFPHHENEIAQSEAATGTTFARYWIHNAMVNLSGEKMAKSTGHVIDLVELLERQTPAAVRLFYLRTHYRKPLEFGDESLADAEGSLDRMWSFRRRVPGPVDAAPDPVVVDRFRAAMDDDFDVAGAVAAVFEAVREGNKRLDAGEDAGPWLAAYDELAGVLGLPEPATDLSDLADALAELATRHHVGSDRPEAVVEALVERRSAARAERDWAASDRIRDDLGALGIVLEDTPDGVRWHRR